VDVLEHDAEVGARDVRRHPVGLGRGADAPA